MIALRQQMHVFAPAQHQFAAALLRLVLSMHVFLIGWLLVFAGNRVISNHFRNIRSMAGDDTQAVYLDDMMSGFLVSGNTFYNCSRALLLGGGRENEFSNNSIDGGDLLSPQNGIHFDNRGEGWDAKGCAPGGINYEFLARVPYTSEAWTKKYGDKLANILEDDICRY